MDPLDELRQRMIEVRDDCKECREDLLDRYSRLDTAMQVLATRYSSVEKLVYAFCGTVLLAALGAFLRMIGWKP